MRGACASQLRPLLCLVQLQEEERAGHEVLESTADQLCQEAHIARQRLQRLAGLCGHNLAQLDPAEVRHHFADPPAPPPPSFPSFRVALHALSRQRTGVPKGLRCSSAPTISGRLVWTQSCAACFRWFEPEDESCSMPPLPSSYPLRRGPRCRSIVQTPKDAELIDNAFGCIRC